MAVEFSWILIYNLFFNLKKNFGAVPNYIIDRKEESTKAKAEYEAYMSEYFKKGALRAMSEDERDAILGGNLIYSILLMKKIAEDRNLFSK